MTRLPIIRKLFGVSLKTYEAEQDARMALAKKLQDETGKRLETMGQYHGERDRHEKCREVKAFAEGERDRLLLVNRDLAHELHRVRGLMLVTFSSKRARALALENREVHLSHLRKLTGGNKFTAKHVSLAVSIAKKEHDERQVTAHR